MNNYFVCLMSLDKSKAGKFVKSIHQKNVYMRFETIYHKNKYDIPDQLIKNLITDTKDYPIKKWDTLYYIFDKTVSQFEEFNDQIFMDVVAYNNVDAKVFLLFEDQCCHAIDNEGKIFCNSFDDLYTLINDIKIDINK